MFTVANELLIYFFDLSHKEKTKFGDLNRLMPLFSENQTETINIYLEKISKLLYYGVLSTYLPLCLQELKSNLIIING